MIDPLGFAFENYDAVGGYRTQDSGRNVDASGSVALTRSGAPVAFKNAVELTGHLANTQEVHRCFATHWFRYALGRNKENGDGASFESAYRAFQQSDTDIKELLVAITQTRSFRYRAPAKGEALQ